MAINITDAEHVAKLARLELSPAELETYTRQLNDVLNYAQELQKIDTTNIEPTYHAIKSGNVLREDQVVDYPNKTKLIENGPLTAGTSFVVPKII